MVNPECFALDDLQERELRATGLRGDRWVDENARLPVRTLTVEPEDGPTNDETVDVLVLDGEWLVNSCPPGLDVRSMPLDKWLDVVLHGAASPGLRARWHLPETDRSEWTSLRVPGSVQSSMIEKDLLEDPYWNTNTYDELVRYGTPDTVPWNMRKTRIEQSEWWYARTFTVPEALLGRRLTMHFDGIDYAASVYVNGRPLGLGVGMFGGPEFDVTRLVHMGENTVVVRVLPPPDNWFGIPKGNPGWGWHYGHLISVGIWKSVRIRATPEVEAENLYVWSPEVTAERATVRVQLDVRSDAVDPAALDAGVVLTAPDGTAISCRGQVTAFPGTTRWAADIEVERPRLWWPRGSGDQPLYTARVALADANGNPVGPALETAFGIRSIEMAQPNLPVAEKEYRWQFVINGLPLFIKGANWCWTDPTNGPEASCRTYLEQALDVGVQMLRAWGGGIVESEEFYDFCDREGILVYQEFPYSWGPPDAPGTDLGVLDDQVRRVVLSRRNHPSLLMWGGGNENYEPAGADDALTLVGRRCRQFDPSRPYHRTDPWGGSAHNYEVYHFGKSMDEGYLSIDSVFYGEFGLPSMPNRRSSLRMLPAEALAKWPPTAEDHGVLAHMHQFQLYDFVKGLRFAHYSPIRTWDEYIEYSQLAQGDGLRFAAERQRAGAVDGTKTGFWFYKLTDLFPGHSWGIVDFWCARKDSYYRAKQVLRARDLFATYDRFDWRPGETFLARLFAANDTTCGWAPGSVVAELYDRDLRLISTREIDAPDLAPNTTIRLGDLQVNLPPGRFPTLLAVRRKDENTSFDSWYWFNFLEKSERMLEIERSPFPIDQPPSDSLSEELIRPYTEEGGDRLSDLPATTLEVCGERTQLVVTNTGSVPAFNVHVRGAVRDVRVDDSGFCLAAGTSRTVEIQDGAVRDVVVTAWNVAAEGRVA